MNMREEGRAPMSPVVPMSIGSVGVLEDDHVNDRVKGWIPPYLGKGTMHAHLLHAIRPVMDSKRSRLNLRVLSSQEPPAHTDITWNGAPLRREVLMPVVGHPRIKWAAYYGATLVSRRQPGHVEQQEHELVRNAERRGASHVNSEISPEILTNPTIEEVDQIVQMYAAQFKGYLCPLDGAAVYRMIASAHVMIAREPAGSKIICIAVGEVASLPVSDDDPEVVLIEISDSAVHPEWGGRGVYSTTKLALIEHLREVHPTALITAEARANAMSCMRTNVGLGMVDCGFQPVHCVISSSVADIQQVGPYGDLRVFFLPHD
ncbi:hypothetical protein H6758_04530 [Candidatus Nomurabacteria bacterium]|nr:hypothetical protein [Candidatus Nomurabacteria bacterium]